MEITDKDRWEFLHRPDIELRKIIIGGSEYEPVYHYFILKINHEGDREKISRGNLWIPFSIDEAIIREKKNWK